MATLTIRNLPDDVHQRLRERAAANRRSMEEEARQTLIADMRPETFDQQKALEAAEEMRALLRAANGGKLPGGGVEMVLADRRADLAKEEADYAQQVADRARRASN